MFLVAFGLLSTIASLYAWRRNPLYSTRATLRYFAVVVFAVAAFTFAVIGTAELTQHASAAVTLGSIGLVTLAGGLALIFLLIKIATPPIAALPKGLTLVNVHRSRLSPWAWRFGWTVLGLVALALVVPANGRDVVYALGAIVAVLAIVMLFAGYVAALDADRSLTTVEATPWVHWRYTKSDWDAWAAVEASRLESTAKLWSWRRDGPRLAFVLVVLAAAMFAFTFNTIPFRWELGFVAGSWALIIGVMAASNLSARTAPQRLHDALLRAAPETYFGAAGVFADGAYAQWATASAYLVEATMDIATPSRLMFLFECIEPGVSSATQVRRAVLIPPNADADIAFLQQQLSLVCPSARVALRAPVADAS